MFSMSYKSKREQVRVYIQEYVLPKLKNMPLDFGLNYAQLVNELIMKTDASPKLIEDVLRLFIVSDTLKEERIILLSDRLTGDLARKRKEEAEQKAKEIEQEEAKINNLLKI